MKTIKLGIDLGTTFSCMAYLDDHYIPTIIPNRENRELTPSIVSIRDSGIIVGDTAYNLLFTQSENVVQSIKRSMGDDTYRFKGYTPTEISAEILKKLKSDAGYYFKQEIPEAVITVPAYFGDAQRKATRQAGELAGFRVLDLPNEPTAAAIYYGVQKMRSGTKILVYDFGGGTFDATILLYEQDNFRILANDGSRELGGKNCTEELIQWVDEKFEEFFGIYPGTDPTITEFIAEECEKAKKRLSKLPGVEIPLSYQGKTEILTLSAEEFDDMIEPVILQTMAKVAEAQKKAGVGWKDIDTILLVGGSTRLKQVEAALTRESGIVPVKFGNVDTIVALGAALYTGQVMQEDGKRRITVMEKGRGITFKTLQESTTFGLGTIVETKENNRVRLKTSVIIKPQTLIPAENSRDGYSTAPLQTEIDIPVVQVEEDGQEPWECDLHTSYRFTGIPPRSTPTPIRVTFRYDKDAMIDVEAVDLESGQKLEKTVIPFEIPGFAAAGAGSTGGPDLAHSCIVLLMDTSGSMVGDPLEEAKREIRAVCDELAKEKDLRLGVVEFGRRIRVLAGLSTGIQQVKDSVVKLKAGSGTPMAEGMELAYDLLENQTGPRYIVLISDGFPNSKSSALKEAGRIKGKGMVLYTIGIGTGGAEFLRKIGDGYRQIDSAAGISAAVTNLLKR